MATTSVGYGVGHNFQGQHKVPNFFQLVLEKSPGGIKAGGLRRSEWRNLTTRIGIGAKREGGKKGRFLRLARKLRVNVAELKDRE